MSQSVIIETGPGRYAVQGDLTFATVDRLLRQSERLIRGPDPVRMDLAKVERVDSAGLALLIEWLRRSRQRGQPIRFCNLPGQLFAIARTAGVDGFLPLSGADGLTSPAGPPGSHG